MERRNGHRAPEAPSAGRGRRIAIVAALAGLLAVAFGGGYLLARGGEEPDGATSPSAAPSPGPSESLEPSPSDGEPSAPPSTPAPADPLEDGRHFVYARSAVAAPRSVRVDLAEFLTGQEAQEAAEERGDEVTNDYYIVNDERRLRSVSVSDTAGVRYIAVTACCDLVDGNWDAFVEAVNDDDVQKDIDGDAPWWIMVEGGEIVEIEQQYLP